jgi:3-mercaptopyruvate sulfurtransferase SseA
MAVKRSAFLALLAVALVGAALWLTNLAVAPREATWQEVQAEAQRGGYRLLRTDELAELYRQSPSGLLVVDTRPEWEYCQGHIPGALNFPLEPTGWSRWWKKKALARFLGPEKNRLIVFY